MTAIQITPNVMPENIINVLFYNYVDQNSDTLG